MRYAFHDGVTWQFETIDLISAGGNISLALRADGSPIASYVQEVEDHWGDIEYAVRYAVRAASGWEATTNAGFTIWHGGWGSTSLALTATGTPLIAFTDPSQGLSWFSTRSRGCRGRLMLTRALAGRSLWPSIARTGLISYMSGAKEIRLFGRTVDGTRTTKPGSSRPTSSTARRISKRSASHWTHEMPDTWAGLCITSKINRSTSTTAVLAVAAATDALATG